MMIDMQSIPSSRWWFLHLLLLSLLLLGDFRPCIYPLSALIGRNIIPSAPHSRFSESLDTIRNRFRASRM